MADRDRNLSSRVLRAALPAGLIVLTAWALLDGYGFISGEFEPRPLAIMLMVGSLVNALLAISLGWTVRRDQR